MWTTQFSQTFNLSTSIDYKASKIFHSLISFKYLHEKPRAEFNYAVKEKQILIILVTCD